MAWATPKPISGYLPPVTFNTGGTGWQQQEFGDRGPLDMAIGPVRGVRWWAMQDDGRLRGAFGCDWAAGENVGVCGKGYPARVARTVRAVARAYGLGSSLSLSYEPPDEPAHEAAAPDCTCGFYAFWRPEPLPVFEQYPVVGVIEGYGRTVIGTRGFRCQKARILGLHIVRTSWGQAFGLPDPTARAASLIVRRYGTSLYRSLPHLLEAHLPTQDYAELPAGDGPA